METLDDITDESEQLRDQLRKVYRVRGTSLEEILQNGRRQLPKDVSKDGAMLIDALGKLGHPKLERTVDFEAVTAARSRMLKHVNGINVWDIRKGKLLKIAGVLAFNFWLIVGLLITWMVWTDKL